MPTKWYKEMQEYAQDCELYERPWVLWETSNDGGKSWTGYSKTEDSIDSHPRWDPKRLYRRKGKTMIINNKEFGLPDIDTSDHYPNHVTLGFKSSENRDKFLDALASRYKGLV